MTTITIPENTTLGRGEFIAVRTSAYGARTDVLLPRAAAGRLLSWIRRADRTLGDNPDRRVTYVVAGSVAGTVGALLWFLLIRAGAPDVTFTENPAAWFLRTISRPDLMWAPVVLFLVSPAACAGWVFWRSACDRAVRDAATSLIESGAAHAVTVHVERRRLFRPSPDEMARLGFLADMIYIGRFADAVAAMDGDAVGDGRRARKKRYGDLWPHLPRELKPGSD